VAGPGAEKSIDGHTVSVAQSFEALTEKLVDGFSTTDLLDRLASDCVDLLDADAAAVVLLNQDGTLEVASSSDDVARALQTVLVETHTGPCLEAFRTGEPISVDSLSEMGHAAPALRAALEHDGYSSVYAIPMRLRSDTIGALNLFNRQAPLSETGRRLAGALAHVATIAIVHQRRLAQATELAEQLQSALQTRIAIERAIGVLAEHGGIDMGAAFDALRGYARAHRLKLRLVAEQVVSRELEPGRLVPPRRR